jgi:hypothetical protein
MTPSRVHLALCMTSGPNLPGGPHLPSFGKCGKRTGGPFKPSFGLRGAAAFCLCLLSLTLAASCGYHRPGAATSLPPDIKILAVPSFQNQTHTYHLETGLTAAVIREFNTRTHYRVVQSAAASPAQPAAPSASQADATLLGTVVSAQVAPVAYDSVTGRASTGLVTIIVKVTLTARDGRVLYSNPNYVFRDQYQISNELASFFEEQGPALDRLQRDFSRTLVSNILEAF